MKDFKSEATGNRIVINSASFKEVLLLKQVIFNELAKNPLGIKLTGGTNLLLDKDIDFVGIIEFVKNAVLSIDSSPEFEEAIFNCLKYCTYKNTYKIDQDAFDNPQIKKEIREDYYTILVACLEENLNPFFKSLISAWKILIENKQIAQLLNLQ